MSFSVKRRLSTSDDTLTGDAAQAINTDLLTLDNHGVFNQGTYSGSTAYQINDIVLSASFYYTCIQAGTGQTPASSPSYWTPLASGYYPTSTQNIVPPIALTGNQLTISGGYSNGTGNGGTLTLTGGQSVGSLGNGGNVVITGGANSNIEGGNGGNITLTPSLGNGGPNGTTILQDATGAIQATISTSGVMFNNAVIVPSSATSPAHSATASITGSTGTVHLDTQFAGTSGSTAYTVNDIITLLKVAGILKA